MIKNQHWFIIHFKNPFSMLREFFNHFQKNHPKFIRPTQKYKEEEEKKLLTIVNCFGARPAENDSVHFFCFFFLYSTHSRVGPRKTIIAKRFHDLLAFQFPLCVSGFFSTKFSLQRSTESKSMWEMENDFQMNKRGNVVVFFSRHRT